MTPVIVTHWYSPLRLLEQSLRRNRKLVEAAEWWLIYGRYPLLGVQDGIPDARQAQNICKELNIDWYDAGDDIPAHDAFQKWSLTVGTGWPMDKKVLLLADDAAPSCGGFLELMEREGAGRDVVTLAGKWTRYPGVALVSLREIYGARIAMPKSACLPKKLAEDLGGPERLGGCYPDTLYDAEYLEWLGVKDAPPFRVWLESRKK